MSVTLQNSNTCHIRKMRKGITRTTDAEARRGEVPPASECPRHDCYFPFFLRYFGVLCSGQTAAHALSCPAAFLLTSRSSPVTGSAKKPITTHVLSVTQSKKPKKKKKKVAASLRFQLFNNEISPFECNCGLCVRAGALA